MHLRREIDELLDESIALNKELDKADKSKEKFTELETQLNEIKDKIINLTREGRSRGLWTDSAEFIAQSIY